MRRKNWAGITAVAMLSLCTAISYVVFGPTRAAADNAHYGANFFPNVELTTQDGKKVKFYDDLIRGKTVALDLIYTHCTDQCPLETARLVEVQKMLGDRVGKDIFFYSITIDPKRDTPEVLKAYMEKFHVGPGWTFLTGNPEDIEMIGRKLGIYSDPDPNSRDGHAPSVLVGNEPTGQWMRNSATDNPRFLSLMIGQFITGWKHQSKPLPNYADARRMNFNLGTYLFTTRCAACHTIGHGDKVGPDLLGITNVREHAWLTRFIMTPEKMMDEKDPIATALFDKYKRVQMPNLRVSPEEAEALVKFLGDQTAAAAPKPQDAATQGAAAIPAAPQEKGAAESANPPKP
ncbi:MAG TPA: SCO family protein [Candidatus Limnocylindrales bacterium]|nr:SCO family protein [Candidatus Limnocylindrales bacterium]